MFKLLKKLKHYMTAFFTYKFDELADPRIQLEQAVSEAHNQHQKLKESAASVIANQKQTEIRLNRATIELEKLNKNTEQAILMADEASKEGKLDEADKYTTAAESFAQQLTNVERQVADLEKQLVGATGAANTAKHAVEQNALRLQDQINTRQKLLSQLDQAKMQEATNKALDALNDTMGRDVPSLASVQEKIEARYAKAVGTAELESGSVNSKMAEIEEATRNNDSAARLEAIRSKLGVSTTAAVEAPVEGFGVKESPELSTEKVR